MSMTDVTCQMPSAPQKLEDTGLSADLVLQMVTKTLHFAGELKGTELAGRLGVPFSVLEASLELLRRERCDAVLRDPVSREGLTRKRIEDRRGDIRQVAGEPDRIRQIGELHLTLGLTQALI